MPTRSGATYNRPGQQPGPPRAPASRQRGNRIPSTLIPALAPLPAPDSPSSSSVSSLSTSPELPRVVNLAHPVVRSNPTFVWHTATVDQMSYWSHLKDDIYCIGNHFTSIASWWFWVPVTLLTITCSSDLANVDPRIAEWELQLMKNSNFWYRRLQSVATATSVLIFVYHVFDFLRRFLQAFEYAVDPHTQHFCFKRLCWGIAKACRQLSFILLPLSLYWYPGTGYADTFEVFCETTSMWVSIAIVAILLKVLEVLVLPLEHVLSLRLQRELSLWSGIVICVLSMGLLRRNRYIMIYAYIVRHLTMAVVYNGRDTLVSLLRPGPQRSKPGVATPTVKAAVTLTRRLYTTITAKPEVKTITVTDTMLVTKTLFKDDAVSWVRSVYHVVTSMFYTTRTMSSTTATATAAATSAV